MQLLARLRRPLAFLGQAATTAPFRPNRARNGAAVACALAALLGAGQAQAQALSLYRQLEGPYDYVVTGSSFRDESNNGDACSVTTTSDAALTLP